MQEQYNRNGLIVTIEQDTNAISPRDPNYQDNMGIMICSHRNYKLGDEQFDSDDFDGWDDLKMHLLNERGAGWVLPLYLYDHSGIKLYTEGNTTALHHQEWDSGQVGFIFVTQTKLEEEYGTIGDLEIEKAIAVLEAEVKVYSQYLEGEVYGFSISNPKNEEFIDSCWGIIGYDEAVKEANMSADSFKHPSEAAYAKKASELHG